MDAFHILRERGKHFALVDFELFTLALSALEWHKHNGSIKLVTSQKGAALLRQYGLIGAWDATEIFLDALDTMDINEEVFWAGAKLFALSRQKTPCVMIDLDFILWKPVDFTVYGRDLAVIHREDIMPSVYPFKDFFHFKEGWKFPDWLDWTARPCNGALVYFGSQAFVREYTAFALDLMQHADAGDDRLCYMVFAEQRWMAMCASHRGTPIHEISSLEGLFDPRQKYFTHLWGYKQTLRENTAEATAFCRKCAARLKRDFPDFAAGLATFSWAEKYF